MRASTWIGLALVALARDAAAGIVRQRRAATAASLVTTSTATANSNSGGSSSSAGSNVAFLSDDVLSSVTTNAWVDTSKSWEVGTLAEALLEVNFASLAVYSSPDLPPNADDADARAQMLSGTAFTSLIDDALANAARAGTDELFAPTENDDAAGDPPSLGVPVLVLASALDVSTSSASSSGVQYGAAAEAQLDYLLNQVPRSNAGAISHRPSQVQLWADFIYMVPPFLAYYGAVNSNKTMLELAYNQIRLYRDQLREPSSGLWMHIDLGSWQDTGLWATGNAWVAAGITRVIATIESSSMAKSVASETEDLVGWAKSVVSAAIQRRSSSNLLSNYLDQNDFGDAASTALMASAGYRLLTLGHMDAGDGTLEALESMRQAVYDKIDSDGWVHSATDPMGWESPVSNSPEAQSFVLLLESAAKQYWETEGITRMMSSVGARRRRR